MKKHFLMTVAVSAQYLPFDLFNLTSIELSLDFLSRTEQLASTGDNRDKIANMLYYRLETSGLDSAPYFADMLQLEFWLKNVLLFSQIFKKRET